MKAATFTEISSATQTVLNILSEVSMHKAFCHSFGITEEELESTPETTATTAYGAYIIDTGLQGELFSPAKGRESLTNSHHR